MEPVDVDDHRCRTYVTMPLSDALAIGKIAEMWANLAPEVLAAEFQTEHGTVVINARGLVTYDPRPDAPPF